jgi:hypothetical protein
MDYFGARYYSSTQGRFTSADEPLIGQDEEDPQTWNLYSYTSGNPLNRIDPDGRRWFYKCDDNGCLEPIWVNPNEDGTYTSPGEGWQEFVPRHKNHTLRILSEDGTTAYHFGEDRDGSPRAFSLQTGMVLDASWDIVGFFIPGKLGIKGLAAGASALWAKHAAKKAASETIEAVAKRTTEIVAKDGTKITGITKHGINRIAGDAAKRAGTKPEAILDALKNPIKIKDGIDHLGRPFKVYTGANARVVVNPKTGNIVSTNPLSRAGAN